LLLLLRAVDWIAHRIGIRALEPMTSAIRISFRWVLTFGGLADRGGERTEAADTSAPTA
jgi:hypothetical protein